MSLPPPTATTPSLATTARADADDNWGEEQGASASRRGRRGFDGAAASTTPHFDDRRGDRARGR